MGTYRFGILNMQHAFWYEISFIANYVVSMSPECAVKKPWCTLFSTPYAKKTLVLVAIDEAHCVLQWLVLLQSTVPHS